MLSFDFVGGVVFRHAERHSLGHSDTDELAVADAIPDSVHHADGDGDVDALSNAIPNHLPLADAERVTNPVVDEHAISDAPGDANLFCPRVECCHVERHYN